MKSAHKKAVFGKVIVYAILILIAVVMIIPFLWMLSASIKSDREVFQMNPFVWIPANPKWDNYVKIWTKIPFGRFVGNTVYLTLIVTFLQLLTSSFAAYSFAKLDFRHKNGLFLAYTECGKRLQADHSKQLIVQSHSSHHDELRYHVYLPGHSR